MKFIVDNQLPPSLSRSLADAGHDSVHVAMVGLDASSDETLWAWAVREDRIVVSKDEDLFFLANRGGDRGRLLWVRIGNCRRERLMTRSRARLPRSSERSSRVSAWSNSRDAGSQEDLGQALSKHPWGHLGQAHLGTGTMCSQVPSEASHSRKRVPQTPQRIVALRFEA